MKSVAYTITIWGLISIMLFQGLCNAFTMIRFYANQRYIAENLCENKDKPAMHCNGHCQLRKNLKENEKSSSSQAPKFVKVEVIICEEQHALVFVSVPAVIVEQRFPSVDGVIFDNYFTEILKPPTTV